MCLCSDRDRAVWREAVQLCPAEPRAVVLVSVHRSGRAAVGTGRTRVRVRVIGLGL